MAATQPSAREKVLLRALFLERLVSANPVAADVRRLKLKHWEIRAS